MRAYIGSEDKGLVASSFYNGTILWNLTPMLAVTGGFIIPKSWKESAARRTQDRLRFEVNHTIIDIYEREHPQLPFCYAYFPPGNFWVYEPTSYEKLSQSWRE